MRAARRLLLLLTLIMLAVPINAALSPQITHWWDSPVESLASKIAGNLTLQDSISLNVKNLSSLDSAAAAGVRAGVESALQRLGFETRLKAAANRFIEITLSENLYDYVWVAKINGRDGEKVAIVSVSRAATTPGAPPEPAISLQRQIIWQQPGKILDFAVLPDAGGGSTLVVLEPERLAFYRPVAGQLQLDRAVPIARAKPWPRDLHGRIDLEGNTASLPGFQCIGHFDSPETIACSETPSDKEAPLLFADATVQIGGRDAEAVRLSGTCGPDSLLLASGAGDWTQPDSIRAYASTDDQPGALSKPLEFAGPVLVLWPSSDRQSARVISRNLLTGMYEVSIVSVSCSR